MSGYYNIPGISEQVFLTFTDWVGYVKDDGTFGFTLQNGVPVGSDWGTLAGKPSTFPPTIGSTSVTAKAGDYAPSWSEINSVIPASATFRPILGTSAVTAKPGNWYPDWSEITNKPAPSVVSWGSISGTPTTLAGYGITDVASRTDLEAILGDYINTATFETRLNFKIDKTDALITPASFYTLRPLNTAFLVHTTRPAFMSYSVEVVVTATIAGGQAGDVILEISPSSTFDSGVQTVAMAGVSQTYSLAITLQGITRQTINVSGFIPAGWYSRIRTVNVTGTPSFSVKATQETTL
jgi:hypothetical protein